MIESEDVESRTNVKSCRSGSTELAEFVIVIESEDVESSGKDAINNCRSDEGLLVRSVAIWRAEAAWFADLFALQ